MAAAVHFFLLWSRAYSFTKNPILFGRGNCYRTATPLDENGMERKLYLLCYILIQIATAIYAMGSYIYMLVSTLSFQGICDETLFATRSVYYPHYVKWL